MKHMDLGASPGLSGGQARAFRIDAAIRRRAALILAIPCKHGQGWVRHRHGQQTFVGTCTNYVFGKCIKAA